MRTGRNLSNFANTQTHASKLVVEISEYFWRYSHSNVLLYMPFSPSRLNCLHLKYHIFTLYKGRYLKLAPFTNRNLIFHILLSE